ncbi:uncharacterized protein LOC134353922 isoform X3 [Mobula hypostoma]|uniref:uncharacterized protein LOC134353922 isoform X3 n=1 Tax=Mobula hypostoma TaxID=723540 RepID=UPI002FC384FB
MSATGDTAATKQKMEKPLQLVYNKDGKLQLNPEAVKVLKSIEDPMVVVAVVGAARSGKSYLMNCLAGDKKGFSVHSTTQAHTKGIWMWCRSLPQRPKEVLLLLDTNGLGDPEKVRSVSRTRNIMNSAGVSVIIFPHVTALHFPFPHPGRKSSSSRNWKTRIWMKILLRSDRNSSITLTPTRKSKNFLRVDWSRAQVSNWAKPHHLSSTEKREFRDLGFVELTEAYVGIMADGILPRVESSVAKLVEQENQTAVSEALKFYEDEINKLSESDHHALSELIEYYNTKRKEAFDIFHKRSNNNNSGKYIKQLEEMMNSTNKSVKVKIEERSQEQCETHLAKEMSTIQTKLTSGRYREPGGFQKLKKDLDNALNEYKEKTKNHTKGCAGFTLFQETPRLDQVQKLESNMTEHISALEEELSRLQREKEKMEQT